MYSHRIIPRWLNCRSGKDATDYDLVVGGVANDRVFNTVELYFDGLIDKSEAINRLRYEKPNLQICFGTEKALGFFYHSEVYQLIRDGVSDMHCMSDAYLAEELEQEYSQKE